MSLKNLLRVMAMDNLMHLIWDNVVDLFIIFMIFAVLVCIGKFASGKFRSSEFFNSSRFFNPQEYLPEEELSTIKQVLYLVMIVILVMNILYLIFGWRDDSFNLLAFDIIVSLYLAIVMDISSVKNKFILFLLIPFGSIAQLVDPTSWVALFDLLHVFAFAYFAEQYYRRFLQYTQDNRLGITIMLLFFIVFISFFVTIVVEGVTPIDSIAMVSNAFTSNGYAILGKSGVGKVNAIFLVWSGFILSGVGTATLTVAIVMRQVNDKFDHLEELVRKNKKE